MAADGTTEIGRASAPSASGGNDAPATPAAGFLAEARRWLDADPHQALRAVDEAFKSRPGFEEWAAAYRTRLEALIRLGETGEAARTYERFRAKLHERARTDRLEELLLDASGPMAEVFDAAALEAELVDLYETMPGRERQFLEVATSLAGRHASVGTKDALHTAVSLLREAISRGGDEARGLWEDVSSRARAAGISVDGPEPEELKARIQARGVAPRVVVVGGDEASRPHAARMQDLGRRIGFEGSLVLGGARPAQRVLADVEEQLRAGATAVVVLHTAGPELREGVRRLAAGMSVPVTEIPYAGAVSLEPELLGALEGSLR